MGSWALDFSNAWVGRLLLRSWGRPQPCSFSSHLLVASFSEAMEFYSLATSQTMAANAIAIWPSCFCLKLSLKNNEVVAGNWKVL